MRHPNETVQAHLWLSKLGGDISMWWAYSHLSNKRGGWNKRGGSEKVAKSINVDV